MQTEYDKSRLAEAPAVSSTAPASRKAKAADAASRASFDVAILTGGQDRHYAVGLGTGLLEQNLGLDVIGSDEVDGPEFQGNQRVRFYNLHGSQLNASLSRRISRILGFYGRLFGYVLTAKPKVFHILWNNKVQLFDRTLLMCFYKLAGKKVVITAHNVNAGRRDGRDSWVNRVTLKFQYALTDNIFVHTGKMKDELIAQFGVGANKITLIPYGINNAVPISDLTRDEARQKLGLGNYEKAILYFGAIKPYKGLENLVAAFHLIADRSEYRLIIAGERKKGCEEYWRAIKEAIESHPSRDKILQRIEFIPDADTEIYFKAADVACLPYTEIFQSGILFLAYAYGLPVIATDVGSFAEDIIEGRNGFICKKSDPQELAASIERYFESRLYRELEDRRQDIRDDTLSKHSWTTVANITRDVYMKLSGPIT